VHAHALFRWGRIAGGTALLLACSWRGATALASTGESSPATQGPVGSGSTWRAAWNELRGDAYPLDTVERWVEAGRRVTCDPKQLVSYRGTQLRYAGELLVDPAFRERLARFEAVVAETAREIYGREPRLIRHYGTYSCRSSRNRSRRISEHALGNALDLVGFDFGPATKSQPSRAELPKQLRWAFQVRVARHWRPLARDGSAGALHARFLASLTQRLQERDDIFRCMFGPGHGGHDDHLHLDVAPWRYVDL
jgi:hypothetical protein